MAAHAMLFLVLAVTCSLAIAVVFKVAEMRDLDRTALLTVNYLAGAILAMALQGVAPAGDLTAGLVALGVGQGVLFIAGFWLFSLAIREAGIGLAAGVMRLSVVVPFLASWAIWGEAPTLWQIIGLVLAGVAFFLVAQPAAEPPASSARPPSRARPTSKTKTTSRTRPAARQWWACWRSSSWPAERWTST